MADLSSKELEELKKNANQTERAVNNLGDSLDSVSSKSNKAAGYIKDANKHIQDMGNSAEKSGKKTADLGKNTENLGKTVKDTGKKAKESEDLFTRMGKAMSKDLSGTAITVAKDISKMGDAMKTGGFDGMMKAAEAGQSLNQVLQLIPGPAGVIVPAVAAAGAGIVAAFRDAHDAAVAADIAGHYGKIRLSALEVEKVAKRLTTTDWTLKLDAHMDAKGKLDQYENSMRETVAEMERLELKVSVGLSLDEDEKEAYRQATDNYVKATRDYLSQQQYTTSIALEAAFSENSGTLERLKGVSEGIYAGAQGEMSVLGRELSRLVNEGFETGVFDYEAIQSIRDRIAKAAKTVSETNYEADLLEFQVTLSGLHAGIDKESVEAVSAKTSEMVAELQEKEKAANHTAYVAINQEYKANIQAGLAAETAEKIKQDAIREMKRNMSAKEATVELQGINYSMDNLQAAYGDEIGTSPEHYEEDLEDQVRSILRIDQWRLVRYDGVAV